MPTRFSNADSLNHILIKRSPVANRLSNCVEIKEAFEPFYGKTTVTEETDPQHLQQLASELKAFRIYDQSDVDRFAEVFFDPENTGTEGSHAKLSSLVQSARDEFMVSNEETQEEFRSTLRSFLRLYKFQSQIVSYADTPLETWPRNIRYGQATRFCGR
ncbi:hypothetical protein [Halorubrum sp. FL23]|uniref:hypothetical protein n=1 Tax=Halorubrum sp. FL23 TaxID=3458704 RepID=UPI004034A886